VGLQFYFMMLDNIQFCLYLTRYFQKIVLFLALDIPAFFLQAVNGHLTFKGIHFIQKETMKNYLNKSKEELIGELQELRQTHDALKVSYEADVIRQKHTMDALQASEERFQLLFNKAPLGYQSLDFDGNFLEVNQQWLDTLGYERDEVIGKWFGDFLTLAFQDGFRQNFPIFKQKGKMHIEFEMVHKNGTVLFIAFDGKIAYDLKGGFKQTHCILQDITEKKHAEKALIESEEKYRLLHENSGIGKLLQKI